MNNEITIDLKKYTERFCIKKDDLKLSIKKIKDEARVKLLEQLKEDLRRRVRVKNEDVRNEICNRIIENYEVTFSPKTCFSYWIYNEEIFIDEKEIAEFCDDRGYIYIREENGNISIFDVFEEEYIIELRQSRNEYLSIEVNYKPMCGSRIAFKYFI